MTATWFEHAIEHDTYSVLVMGFWHLDADGVDVFEEVQACVVHDDGVLDLPDFAAEHYLRAIASDVVEAILDATLPLD